MTKRKPMDDAAAFVYGGDSDQPSQPPSPQPAPKTTPAQKKERAIDKLMTTAEQERQVRITVDLVASQHQGLTMASAQLGKSKAEIIRALIDDFLTDLNQ